MVSQRKHKIAKRVQSFLLLFLVIVATMAASFAADVGVKIKTWKVPSASHYPHDPMVSRDGSVWYGARFSNTLGRFDPKTEQFKEYVTDIPNSGPHGIVEDKEGNVWFTAIDAKPTYIGKLNPKTGEFTEYPVKINTGSPNNPEPASAHTLILDQKGTVWFTMLGSDMIGRLVPSTGKITVARSAVRPVGPYGIVVSPKGIPFFTLFRTNKLGSLDPDTMAVRTYSVPNPQARPRRLAITPDDVVWYTDHERGKLGRFDPKTGEFNEWPTPGGEWSRPYGMVAVGDVIWYNESWMDPTLLVRFDTKTKQFRSWPIEDCFDGIYHMVADSDQNLWFTCHATDRIGKVEIMEGR
ncbi:MAG: hypothetical protein A3F68_05085 [Acidobacteria bacterium RIFCSPLOWO2_12_FULL_54_10]|nr:MAG: hypothetical protein A3F68_05085 [Acidobacteria bacterium RIFCSPLOWO2_12_FULL_54_10]